MQPCPLINSTAPWPLLPNDTMELMRVIETALEHFNQVHSSSEENYLTQLRIISHCYYLVSIELGEEPSFSSFADMNIKEHPERISSYALSIADQINTISDKVRLLDYPWFYPHFINAVKQILSDKIAYLSVDLAKTHHLLNKIIHFGRGSKQ